MALARAATIAVVAVGDEAAALSDLPVGLLRLPATILERLTLVGLRTIGDLLRLPRGTLSSRFDEILPRRLDQALARRPEPFIAERPREPPAVIREWEVPIEDKLTLALVCRQMLHALLSEATHPAPGSRNCKRRFDEILPQRLDQALARRPELFIAERLREPPTVVREWEVPLEDRLTLALVCRQMLHALLSEASHPGAGSRNCKANCVPRPGPSR